MGRAHGRWNNQKIRKFGMGGGVQFKGYVNNKNGEMVWGSAESQRGENTQRGEKAKKNGKEFCKNLNDTIERVTSCKTKRSTGGTFRDSLAAHMVILGSGPSQKKYRKQSTHDLGRCWRKPARQ